jgi:hypothetical protein
MLFISNPFWILAKNRTSADRISKLQERTVGRINPDQTGARIIQIEYDINCDSHDHGV